MADELRSAGIGAALLGDADLGLQGLIDRLDGGGLRIDTRQRALAASLLAELVARDEGALRGLAPYRNELAALLAHTQQERETFFTIFDAVAGGAVSSAGEALARTPPHAGAEAGRRVGRRVWIAGGAFAAAALALVALLLFWPRSSPEQAEAPVSVGQVFPSDEAGETPLQAETPNADTTSVDTVLKAAQRYAGAPTLKELGSSFAQSSPIGWSAEAYELRLAELTGLPRDLPLAIVAPSTNDTANWAEVARALDRIETPGRAMPPNQYAALTAQRISAGAPSGFNAQSVAAQLAALSPAPNVPLQRTAAVAAVRQALGANLDDDVVVRALAIVPGPLQRIWREPQEPAAFAWAPWAAVGVVMLGLLLWLAQSLETRRAFLRRRAPRATPVWATLFSPQAIRYDEDAKITRDVMRRLRRRFRRGSRRLDVEATINATIAGGGEGVAPVFAQDSATPEYLVLIERRSSEDLDYLRLRALVSRLAEMVDLEVYTYQGEPTLLRSEARDAPIPIEMLMGAFPDHRLIILGTGEGFLDPMTGAPIGGASQLKHWRQRALLTPLPVAEWAQEEAQVARAMDMPVARATGIGLLQLAEKFTLNDQAAASLDTSGDNGAAAISTALRLRPERYLANAPPADHPVAQIVLDVRNSMDADAFEWFCALAVYPAVQWDLTVFLGAVLKSEGAASFYSEDRLASLAQLPWMRAGFMPGWLRRALIAELTPKRAKQIRDTLRAALDAAGAAEAQLRHDSVTFRLARESRGASGARLNQDEVFIDFMARGEMEDLEIAPLRGLNIPWPRNWRFGWPELAAVALAAAYAVAAFVISPRDAGLAPSLAAAPLLLLTLSAALALMIARPRPAYAVARSLLAPATVLAGTGAGIALLLLSGQGVAQAVSGSAASMWPYALWIAIAGVVVCVPLSLLLVRRAGMFVPRMRVSAANAALLALGCALVVALATFVLPSIASIFTSNPWLVLTFVLAVFAVLAALGWALRGLPERLTVPDGRKPVAPRLFESLKGAAVAACLVPAVLVWGALRDNAAITASPNASIAASGRHLAIADGSSVTLLDLARPWSAGRVVEFSAPVSSVALSWSDGAQARLAVVGRDRMLTVLDASSLARIFSVRLDASRRAPMVAFADNGAWVVAYEDRDGASRVLVDRADRAWPGTAAISAIDSVAPGVFAVGTESGELVLATLSGDAVEVLPSDALFQPLAIRLSSVRTVSPTQVEALADDGRVVKATLAANRIASISLETQPGREIGPAVPWVAPRGQDAGPDLISQTPAAALETPPAVTAPPLAPGDEAFAEAPSAASGGAVTVQVVGEVTRIRIATDRPVQARSFMLATPDRFVVDLTGVRVSVAESAGAGVVRRVRMSNRSDGIARFVFDLTGQVRLARQELGSRTDPTLTFDLAATAAPVLASTTRSIAPPPATGGRRTIVIDPGHGGRDPGAIGATGVREKDVALDIALKLRDALEATGRYRVVLTRDSDVFIELEERVRLVRAQRADLFISIHADSSANSDSTGASVYTLSERGAVRAQNMAESQNWDLDLGGAPTRGVVSDILVDLAQRETTNRSALFAMTVIPRIGEVAPLLRNTHRSASFFVLLAPDVPAVLIETGFLSNVTDERRLADPRQRQAFARALQEAVDQYFAAPARYPAN